MRTDPATLLQLRTVCGLRELARDTAQSHLHEQRALAQRLAEQGRQAQARETAHGQEQAARLQRGHTFDPQWHRLGLAHASQLQQQTQQAQAQHTQAEQAEQLARLQWLQARLAHDALEQELQRHRRALARQRERQHERGLEDRPPAPAQGTSTPSVSGGGHGHFSGR